MIYREIIVSEEQLKKAAGELMHQYQDDPEINEWLLQQTLLRWFQTIVNRCLADMEWFALCAYSPLAHSWNKALEIEKQCRRDE